MVERLPCVVDECFAPRRKKDYCQYHESLRKALQARNSERPSPVTSVTAQDERVYAVFGADLIKIGKAINAMKRLSSLQTGSPIILELLADMPGSIKLERRIHKALRDYHSHGEWFEYRGAVIEVVKKMKSGNVAKMLDFLDDLEKNSLTPS